MKLLVGLGNPGELYTNNRHNVGFHFLDYVISHIDMHFPDKLRRENSFERSVKLRAKLCHLLEEILLAKPQTYMNLSGVAVRKIQQFYKIQTSDIFIAHDDLDIPFGNFKIQQGKGPKVHNGLFSIEQTTATNAFWRIRIGVENRGAENRISGHDYVLSNFTNEETKQLPTVFEKIMVQLEERKIMN
jgi:PTH1 family peptidyl-tRNA hydrolase